MDFNNQVVEHKRSMIRDLLEQCTEKQQAFFKRLYPMGIEELPEDKMKRAYEQCEDTLIKNHKGA